MRQINEVEIRKETELVFKDKAMRPLGDNFSLITDFRIVGPKLFA